MTPAINRALDQAAQWLRDAEALFIGAGAGFGVDSGLPDFRGREGFWAAYPPFAGLGLAFEELANPRLFRTDPPLAWGFYGHRLNVYRRTAPHPGFALLRSWINRLPGRGFVYTSNVDGQFQRAGFSPDEILECHGSIHFVQHVHERHGSIWSADDLHPAVDEATMRARAPLPERDGALLRPNILMFGDDGWNPDRARRQLQHYRRWTEENRRRKIVAIELGAGTAVPTVRLESERLLHQWGSGLIRINPRESDAPPGSVSLPLGALTALQALEQRLQSFPAR